MNRFWYVMQCKPNKERILTKQLESCHINFYFPQIKVCPVNPRCRKILPYFPGYLFIQEQVEKNNWFFYNHIPGAIGLISIGGEIASVPENFIETLRIKIEQINGSNAKIFDKLKSGDLVNIDSGPFAGYEAIFDSYVSGTERVRVLLTMLQKRLLPIELSRKSISLQKTI